VRSFRDLIACAQYPIGYHLLDVSAVDEDPRDAVQASAKENTCMQ
jgi:hypothetical protein